MPNNTTAVTLCARCHTYPLEYRVLPVTGDIYGVCSNYPECGYVTPFLENPPTPASTPA